MKERLKKLRQTLGLTQIDFADRLGVSKGTVGGWEIGASTPTARRVLSICELFNVRREWLESGEGDMFEKEKIDGAMSEDEKSERLMLAEFRRLSPKNQDALLRFIVQLAEDPRYRA